MHYLNPKFQTPNCKYLSKVMLPNLRSIIELQIQKDISVIPYYFIAVDSWTSIANKAYLSITFHGVTSNWILKSYVLDVIAIKKTETGKNIADLIKEVLNYWHLSLDNLISITSDGVANIKNAVKEELNALWIYCFAHIINQLVQIALKANSIKVIVKKASIKKITLSNKTRWNYIFLVLQSWKWYSDQTKYT